MYTGYTGKLISVFKKEAILAAQTHLFPTIIFTWKLSMHQKSGQYRQHPGMTNIAALVALTLIIAFFTEIIISRVVSMLMFTLMFMSSCWFWFLFRFICWCWWRCLYWFWISRRPKAPNPQAYSSGPIFEMPMSGLIVHSFWNATSASWVFFNREALRFAMMRTRVTIFISSAGSNMFRP